MELEHTKEMGNVRNINDIQNDYVDDINEPD
jgi:hypothetical protein